jgi:hypothetical protein
MRKNIRFFFFLHLELVWIREMDCRLQELSADPQFVIEYAKSDFLAHLSIFTMSRVITEIFLASILPAKFLPSF